MGGKKGNHVLEAWIERGLFLLALVVPLAISPVSTDMYNVPKFFLVQALILLLFALALLRGSVLGSFQFPWTPLTLPALAFFGLTLLSLTRALDLYEGIAHAFRLFCLLLLLHLAAQHLRGRARLDRLFAAVGIAAAIVASYGILQAKGIDFVRLEWRFYPVSTLGNTGFAAEYLISTLPLLLLMAAEGGRLRRSLYGGSALLATIHLLLTKSRGGWLALLVALLAMALLGGQKAKDRRQKAVMTKVSTTHHPPPTIQDPTSKIQQRRPQIMRVVLFAVAVTGIAIGLAFVFPDLWHGTLQRIASAFDPRYPSNRVRLLIWASTLKMIWEAPLLGVGVGNYELVYPLYRTVEEWRLSSRFIVGEAHNDYLQIAAETGLLGLLCFLWLLVRLLKTASSVRRGHDETLRRRGLALAGGLVALLAYAFLGFPLQNPASSLHFWLFAGLLCAIEADASARPLRSVRTPLGVAWGVAIPLFALASVLVFGRFFADLHLKRMKAFLASGREAEAKAAYDRAVFLYFPNFYAHQLRTKAFDDRRMLPLAAEKLRADLKERPFDARLHAELGTTYGEMGLYGEAVRELKEALRLDPALLEAWENLGYAYFLQGRYEEAVEVYREALRMGRESAALRAKLALALFKAGEVAEAEEEWTKAGQLQAIEEGEGRNP